MAAVIVEIGIVQAVVVMVGIVVAIALMWIVIVVFVVVVFVVVVASIDESTGHRGFNSSCLGSCLCAKLRFC